MPWTNRQDYPPDWKERSRRVKERDGDRCAFCGVPNHRHVVRFDGEQPPFEVLDSREVDDAIEAGWGPVYIVLTVAHLIEGGELDCPDEDLAALAIRMAGSDTCRAGDGDRTAMRRRSTSGRKSGHRIGHETGHRIGHAKGPGNPRALSKNRSNYARIMAAPPSPLSTACGPAARSAPGPRR